MRIQPARAIHDSKDMDERKPLPCPCHVMLNRESYVHIVEYNQVLPAPAIGCTALCPSTARPTQPMMKAVKDSVSSVRALCSRRNSRALVTSNSIKPCIIGLR